MQLALIVCDWLEVRLTTAGILRDWKLVFRGMGGMGDIQAVPGASFHGILHHLTCAEFKHLDTIEATYLRTPVEVECYDGTKVNG